MGNEVKERPPLDPEKPHKKFECYGCDEDAVAECAGCGKRGCEDHITESKKNPGTEVCIDNTKTGATCNLEGGW